MYRVCVVEENPLIRRVLKSVLADNEFEVQDYCEISERCPAFGQSCRVDCPKTEPCRNLLILFNCERDSRGIGFLKFVDNNQCPCVHSFKVLYTCEELAEEEIERLSNLHVQLVEKENPVFDMLPVLKKYKKWFRTGKVPA
jgi:CheY-like chemotaxis protein